MLLFTHYTARGARTLRNSPDGNHAATRGTARTGADGGLSGCGERRADPNERSKKRTDPSTHSDGCDDPSEHGENSVDPGNGGENNVNPNEYGEKYTDPNGGGEKYADPNASLGPFN